MGGISSESTWAAISHSNIEGTYCVLEAARRSGVPRVVLASSNHATGYTPRPDWGLLTEADAPPRPDTYYGVAKVTMEALGSLYADRYGLDVVCLRIGSAFAEPTSTRHLSTWLSPADTVSLVDAALSAPSPGFSVVWGVSDNTRNWWDLTAARALGYEPADDAEVYAEALIEVHGEPDLADPVHGRVGGEFTTAAFDAENFEPPAPRADIAPGSGAQP
jgi:uronate dehydrogenase